MDILQIFRPKKEEVVTQWIESVYACYPLDTTGFLRTKKDDFCNPVGEITTTMAHFLFDAAAGEHVLELKLRDALQRFVKLRSVQDFTPSKGLGVMFIFKQYFRDAFLEECASKGLLKEYLECESRIDTLSLMAFDIYIASRETLAENRIAEIRNAHSQIVRMAQRQGIIPDGMPL